MNGNLGTLHEQLLTEELSLFSLHLFVYKCAKMTLLREFSRGERIESCFWTELDYKHRFLYDQPDNDPLLIPAIESASRDLYTPFSFFLFEDTGEKRRIESMGWYQTLYFCRYSTIEYPLAKSGTSLCDEGSMFFTKGETHRLVDDLIFDEPSKTAEALSQSRNVAFFTSLCALKAAQQAEWRWFRRFRARFQACKLPYYSDQPSWQNEYKWQTTALREAIAATPQETPSSDGIA